MISPRIRRIIREENCFDGLPEQAGNAEGKTQARVISACLQRVNGLPGDSQFTSKNGLTPVVVLTQCPELIFHKWGLHLAAVVFEFAQVSWSRQGRPVCWRSRLRGSIRSRTGGGGGGRVRPALRSSL